MGPLWSADPSYDVVIWRSAGILPWSILGVGSALRILREMSSGRYRIPLVHRGGVARSRSHVWPEMSASSNSNIDLAWISG